MKKLVSILFGVCCMFATAYAHDAQAVNADAGQRIVLNHTKPLVYVSAVSRSTTWTGERVVDLGYGQCERETRRLVAMRHLNGVDLPDIAVNKVVAPCGLLGAVQKP